MGNFLDCPNTTKDSDLFTSTTGIVCGVTGMQGWRMEMEDDHIAIDIPSQRDHIFLAVFDGHGGAGAAKFAARNMVQFLEKTEEWKQYVSSGAADVTLLGRALQQSFLDIDVALRAHQATTLGAVGADTSGCTAVTAVITPRHIICSNAGDSRCVLGTNSMAKGLSEDHKPTDDLERKRIENAGGSVQWKRVDGDLAVSRAFGDFQFKQRTDLPADQQKVSCFPDIRVHERVPEDDVLLLACDGLWDVMTNNEAIDLVRSIYLTGETSIDKIAEEMVDIALEKGSRDNISAIVVPLPGATYGPAKNGGVDGLREQRAAKHRGE